MNNLIPSDIKEGYNKFLFLTVFKDNVDQDFADLQEALFGIAMVTKSVVEFLEHDGKHPIVLVSTIGGAVNGGTDNENSDILIDFLKDKKFGVYWDEAHFGGSSSQQT
jgi:hypothetical protein